MTSPIECLPVEVFELIALGLSVTAYQQLRLASRQLHLLSFSTFAKRCFSELTTTLGSPSLDRLVAISKHAYFCEVVTLLDIKLLTHRDYKLLMSIQKAGIFPPPKRFPVVPGVKQEQISGEVTLYDDVFGREYPQCITDRLTRSLGGFPNLRGVRFRAYSSEPVGWQSIAMPEGDQVFRTKCFHAVVDAIVKSEIQLDEFSMAKKKRTAAFKKCANLAYPALQFPFSVLPSLQHCFTHLQSLTLTIIAAHNGGSRIPGWENSLSNFISCAPSIRSLALSLDRKGLVSHYSAAIIRSLALSCRLNVLEAIHIGNCSFHDADLIKFLIAHAEFLACISLSDVRLLTSNWGTFLTALQDLQVLRRVRIVCLDGTRTPVSFRRRDNKRSKLVLDSTKTGRPMSELLGDVLAAARDEATSMPDGNDVPE